MNELIKYKNPSPKRHSSELDLKTLAWGVGSGLSALTIPIAMFSSATVLAISASAICALSGWNFIKRKFGKSNVPQRIMKEIENFSSDYYSNERIARLFVNSITKNISESIIKEKLKENIEFNIIVPSKVLVLKNNYQYQAFKEVTTLALAIHYKDGILNIQTSKYEMEQFNNEFMEILSMNGDLEDLFRKAAETKNMRRTPVRKNKLRKAEDTSRQFMVDYMKGYSDTDRIVYDKHFKKKKDNGPFSRGYWDRPIEFAEPEHGRTIKIV